MTCNYDFIYLSVIIVKDEARIDNKMIIPGVGDMTVVLGILVVE